MKSLEEFEGADKEGGKLHNFLVPLAMLVGFTVYFDIDVWMDLIAAMVFLCMVALSFATGSSWGIFATTISIVMPPASALGADIPLVIGALMSASAFGSQACFYSDARLLAAQGTGCNLIGQASTQLPYTLVAAGVACVGLVVVA